jgi:acyl carrier protein
MTREEIVEKVIVTLSEEFNVEKELITPDAYIYETLQMDSLDITDLTAVVQFTFRVKIPIPDMPRIRTFSDLYDYIESHI